MEPAFYHVDGNLGQDTIQPVQVQMLNGNYLNILANKIEELKQTSGNQDVQNGAAQRRRYGSECNRGVAGIGGQEQQGSFQKRLSGLCALDPHGD